MESFDEEVGTLVNDGGGVFGSLLGLGLSGDGFLEEVVQLGDIKFGLLQHLDLPDNDVAERVHEGAALGDGFGGGVGQQVLHEVGQVVGAGLLLDDVGHFLSDDLHGLSLGVRGLGDLVRVLLGESDHEHAHNESVHSLHFAYGFDQGLPLADEVAQFVAGHVESVETGSAESSFHVFNLQFDFSPGLKINLYSI